MLILQYYQGTIDASLSCPSGLLPSISPSSKRLSSGGASSGNPCWTTILPLVLLADCSRMSGWQKAPFSTGCPSSSLATLRSLAILPAAHAFFGRMSWASHMATMIFFPGPTAIEVISI